MREFEPAKTLTWQGFSKLVCPANVIPVEVCEQKPIHFVAAGSNRRVNDFTFASHVDMKAAVRLDPSEPLTLANIPQAVKRLLAGN